MQMEFVFAFEVVYFFNPLIYRLSGYVLHSSTQLHAIINYTRNDTDCENMP